jgi:hypothetical protein
MAVTMKPEVRFGPYDATSEGGAVTEWRGNLDIPNHPLPVDVYFPVHRTRSMV